MNKQAGNLVTIIIPVFNTRAYLDRCIGSAADQTHREIEIILINDGSTDGSGKICDDYAARDPRIHVIHRENGGSSAARNAGLDQAKGQWITFLDSDDYISKYFVEECLSACTQFNADVAVCRHLIDHDGVLNENKFPRNNKTELLNRHEALIRHFGKSGSLFNIMCSKLFRASLWSELRLPVGMIWEDLYVSHHIYHSAKTVALLDARLYAYYMAPGGIMRSPFSLKRLDALEAWREGVRLFAREGEHEFSDIARRILCNRLFDAYGLCKKKLPDECEVHKRLRSQAIDTYNEVKRVRGYIDLSRKRFIAYRLKQIIGRYSPFLYSAIFLRKVTYNI